MLFVHLFIWVGRKNWLWSTEEVSASEDESEQAIQSVYLQRIWRSTGYPLIYSLQDFKAIQHTMEEVKWICWDLKNLRIVFLPTHLILSTTQVNQICRYFFNIFSKYFIFDYRKSKSNWSLNISFDLPKIHLCSIGLNFPYLTRAYFTITSTKNNLWKNKVDIQTPT